MQPRPSSIDSKLKFSKRQMHIGTLIKKWLLVARRKNAWNQRSRQSLLVSASFTSTRLQCTPTLKSNARTISHDVVCSNHSCRMGTSISTGNDCIFCLQGIKALQSGCCENTGLNAMIDLFEEIRAAHLLSCDEAPETPSAAPLITPRISPTLGRLVGSRYPDDTPGESVQLLVK